MSSVKKLQKWIDSLSLRNKLCYKVSTIGARFHPTPDPVRHSNPKAIEPKFYHHRDPRGKHRLTEVKAPLQTQEAKKPNSEESTQNIQKSKTLKAIIKASNPRRSSHAVTITLKDL